MEKRELDTRLVQRTFSSLDEFFASGPSMLKSGVYRVEHGLPILVKWTNKNADLTVVSFSAAGTREMKTMPVFSGVNATKDLPCNVLLFSDPTMLLDRDTTITWFAGSRFQPNLQSDISKIILAFCNGGDVLLTGGSGGGYSALVQHYLIGDATTFVVNPSTRIAGRPIFQSYIEKMWNAASVEDLPGSLIVDLADVFSERVNGEIYYLQNSLDQNFVRNYFWPFLDSVSKETQLYCITPCYGRGHVPLTSESYKNALSVLLRERDWEGRRRGLAALEFVGRRQIANQLLGQDIE